MWSMKCNLTLYFTVIKGTFEKIENGQDSYGSSLMVRVTGVFKGSDSSQNKLVKIAFAEDLNR